MKYVKWYLLKANSKNSNINPGDIIARVDEKYFRPAEVDSLIGDASKARDKLDGPQPLALKKCVKR